MSQIKQLQPKEGVALLAVKVPEGAWKFSITSGDNNLHYKIGTIRHIYDLPEGNWRLLGIATDIPEEVWKGIVHKQSTFGDYYYVSNGKSFETATEAAMSFLEANEVYSVNPLGDEPKDRPDLGLYTKIIREKHMMWQQAEANTGTWVILAKS